MSNTQYNIHDMKRIVGNMAKGMNVLVENYNFLITLEEKVINLQKGINNIRTKSYMAQNILEKSFEELENFKMRIEDVFSTSSEAKNISKVDLDMPSQTGKNQVTTNTDNIRTRDISLSIDKNISKGIQEMHILSKDKSLVNNSPL